MDEMHYDDDAPWCPGMLAKIGLAAFATLLNISSASADFILLTCGPTTGYTYYVGHGWKKDGVNAQMQVLVKDNGGVDLISSGPGNTFSYSADGCTFSRPALGLEKNELVLVATCGRHIETFFFRWNADKSGEVVSVDIAATPLSRRGGALQAACRLER
jgi:hypothetical protein